MQVTIQKWGNSLAIRIPGSYAKDINLQQGTEVDLLKETDKLVIIPKKTGLKLKNLLNKVTAENMHKEEFAGGAVGKEIW
ncbi:MAG: AbrB/MazE/SpoVT family DNA-binding domain-containing protein [Chloroflexi bacterium HGW-Chloroflexi-5]|jgi:antitoxin MazE|nr:MAG: AbrB/MazE/SpoVT family DNA-binding domain-containing protein [Deltaproteobacteria bacterium HGW-Deltaproteobacteria-12]PKN96694.1 MAG: AbrB/MazE/SpoVT family DNA-binding domain-containing protein [Chloroflexi bacterium HGW-Chloroflexi-5]